MNKINTQKGQVIIINTLLFFTLSIAIIFAVTSPVISSFQITKSFLKSKQAFMVANSASNEALYKLNTNKNLASAETVTLAQGFATIMVADTSDGKTISIKSDVDSYERNYELRVLIGDGVSFNYGVQSGQGGFYMEGTSGIIGNIYSNGNIIGTGGAYVTGSAIAANIPDSTTAVSNSGNIESSAQITFGGNTTPKSVAQSFTINNTDPVSSVRILIKKSGTATMNNITMYIVADKNNKPDKTIYTQATISSATVSSSFNYLTVPLNSTVYLDPDTKYWIVFDTSINQGQHYSLGANIDEYLDGTANIGAWSFSNGGTWNNTDPINLDAYFDINVGGSAGLIEGVNVGSSGQGDAWAYEVKNSTIAGNVYCQIGSSNGGKPCNTSRSNPVSQPWPISDGNIQDWKEEAVLGGATSTVSLGNNEVKTLGPVQINGDLIVSGGVLNVTGTLYVTGNIIVDAKALIRIDPAIGVKSAVIITDGRVMSSGGGEFQGSGASGSWILLATTSTCPEGTGCSNNSAISIAGGTGAVVLNAQKGTIKFSGGAQARQATGYKITMEGGTTITYESGLQNPNFTSGPSGSWMIGSWKEVE